MTALPLTIDIPWEKRLSIEGNFHRLSSGGHLAVLDITDSEQEPNELLKATKRIIQNLDIRFYTYTRNLTYCRGCRKTFHGILQRCPLCNSVNQLVYFGRLSAKYSSLPSQTSYQHLTLTLTKRKSYRIFMD